MNILAFRRLLVAVALVAPLIMTAVVAPAASAATGAVGAVGSATQENGTGIVTVTGWAYDTRRSAASILVRLFVDGHYAGTVRAARPSPRLDRARHLTGGHGYRFSRVWPGRAHAVAVVAANGTLLGRAPARPVASNPGARIVAIAKRYVGRAPYVDGGASPRGFDCSGYTMYVYAQAHVHALPHNAEAQRHVPGMHRITRAAARPGDLIFYFSGGPAYHVAIYAGHGMQYAAATPRDGIRYQAIWSSQVEFRTIWH